MVPLVWLTSSKKIMGERFVNAKWVAILGWVSTIVLTILNLKLILEIVGGWL